MILKIIKLVALTCLQAIFPNHLQLLHKLLYRVALATFHSGAILAQDVAEILGPSYIAKTQDESLLQKKMDFYFQFFTECGSDFSCQ